MNRSAFIAAIVIALWATAPVHGEDVTAGGLKISAAWARATPKAAPVGGGYLTITIQKTNCRILDMTRYLMLEAPSPPPT